MLRVNLRTSAECHKKKNTNILVTYKNYKNKISYKYNNTNYLGRINVLYV